MKRKKVEIKNQKSLQVHIVLEVPYLLHLRWHILKVSEPVSAGYKGHQRMALSVPKTPTDRCRK